jgi:multidrug efflux pump subunit AcrB
MNLVRRYIEKPHLILSFVILLSIVGIMGYSKMPFNLFPDTDRSQISVVTVQPGAAAADVETDITRLIEKEVSSVDMVRKVTSTSKDEVSVVLAEFEYEKGLDSAATDVANALSKVTARLPQGIRPPQVFKISQATQPTMTLVLSPKERYPTDLRKVRELADNQIKEDLLRIPNVGNVEVFGGHQPEILVSVQPYRLNRFGISLTDIMAAVGAQNQNIPQGIIIRKEGQYLFKTQGAATGIGQLGGLVIARRDTGVVHLRDVAKIEPAEQEPQSVYHGNGKEGIGINILRNESGHTLDPIVAIENNLPRLKAAYPFVNFEISYTQKRLITQSVDNMLSALREAIIVTVIVIFLFLGNFRTMALCAISIPFTYLITFAIMWLCGFEFHMVTLTGVILAVGMLLDDAIVVIENIERHYRQEGKDLKDIVAGGTQEVMLAIFSGTYATIVVLVPIIFVGGYVQTVLRPLALSLSIALAASYLVSVTIIPILAPYILKAGPKRTRFEHWIGRWSDRFVNGIRDFFGGSLDTALKHRFLFVAVALVLWWVTTQFVQPLVGRNVQPSMDTGIVKINFETDANSSLAQSNEVLVKMEDIIRRQEGVISISSTLGSEPSVVSFGSGKNPQQGNITVNLVDRFHRKQSMWGIEEALARDFHNIPGIKSVDVFDYGATAMSSLRAFVDVMVTGPDPKEVYRIGEEVKKRLDDVRGLKSTSLSWGLDKKEIVFTANRERYAYYGISPKEIAAQAQTAVQGGVSSIFRVAGEDGFPVRIRLEEAYRHDISGIESFRVHTPSGEIPFSLLGSITTTYVPSLLTRQDMQNSIDVFGYRDKAALSHVMTNVQMALKGLKLPPGYAISQEGDAKQGGENQAAFSVALLVGMVLLYFTLVPAFNSFIHPLTIMTAIPLAMIGAIWSLLIADKTQSTAANMGLILLAGIVVKNSILLIDFIEMAKERGLSTIDALRESVRVRTRPIIMTAFGTAVGMVPIALERAIGLERLSPLAVVAIGGLMVSTFLTLLYVPIFYTIFEDAMTWLKTRTVRLPWHPKVTASSGGSVHERK